MAIVYDPEPAGQIFNRSDIIDIEGVFTDLYSYLKQNNKMFKLLSGDVESVSLSSFNKITHLTEEEELTFRLMNLSNEDIKNITIGGIQNNNIRSFSLGIVKNIPSPILSYNYKSKILTSVFVYSDSDEEYNAETEKINNTKRDATIFNLVENMMGTYLLFEKNIPLVTGTSNICLSRSITASDCKFILYYYSCLFMTLVKYLPESVILKILEYRIKENSDTMVIPGYDVLKNLLDEIYNSISLDDMNDRPRIMNLLQSIYYSCIATYDAIDEFEMSILCGDIEEGPRND